MSLQKHFLAECHPRCRYICLSICHSTYHTHGATLYGKDNKRGLYKHFPSSRCGGKREFLRRPQVTEAWSDSERFVPRFIVQEMAIGAIYPGP